MLRISPSISISFVGSLTFVTDVTFGWNWQTGELCVCSQPNPIPAKRMIRERFFEILVAFSESDDIKIDCVFLLFSEPKMVFHMIGVFYYLVSLECVCMLLCCCNNCNYYYFFFGNTKCEWMRENTHTYTCPCSCPRMHACWHVNIHTHALTIIFVHAK